MRQFGPKTTNFSRSTPKILWACFAKVKISKVGRAVYTDDPLFGCCRKGGAFDPEGASPLSLFCRSWYSWKHGTIQRFVWHSGQWYLVLRRKIRPWSSMVFQQKLQPSAGPARMTGQCCDRLSVESSRVGWNKSYFKFKINICNNVIWNISPAVMK